MLNEVASTAILEWDIRQNVSHALDNRWDIIAAIAAFSALLWDVDGEPPKRDPNRILILPDELRLIAVDEPLRVLAVNDVREIAEAYRNRTRNILPDIRLAKNNPLTN